MPELQLLPKLIYAYDFSGKFHNTIPLPALFPPPTAVPAFFPSPALCRVFSFLIEMNSAHSVCALVTKIAKEDAPHPPTSSLYNLI